MPYSTNYLINLAYYLIIPLTIMAKPARAFFATERTSVATYSSYSASSCGCGIDWLTASVTACLCQLLTLPCTELVLTHSTCCSFRLVMINLQRCCPYCNKCFVRCLFAYSSLVHSNLVSDNWTGWQRLLNFQIF